MFEYRNPQLLDDGRIDCEIRFKSPDPRAHLGWMGFTADPADRDPDSIGPRLHSLIAGVKGWHSPASGGGEP